MFDRLKKWFTIDLSTANDREPEDPGGYDPPFKEGDSA